MTGLPNVVLAIAILALAGVFGWLGHQILFRLLAAAAAGRGLFWRSLVKRTRAPVLLGMIILALAIGTNLAPLTIYDVAIIRHVLLIGFIILLAWVARTALHIWMIVYLRRFKLDTEDNLLARKHVTQAHILERVFEVLIVVVGLSAALMTFEGVRQYGISLLASAGAAGIIVGLALQPLLKNLFAGIQLAITQPIRIDDAVIVEGEWGNVEEITSTYVVIRIWDLRRLILPLSYFIEQPFQNWTREDASLTGAVMIYLDYSVPVASIRQKVAEIAAASAFWDGKFSGVQVTDFRETTMEVRILVSAADAGKAFNLRCEIREKLVAFLVENYPHALPRLRARLDAEGTEKLV
jgi:small-conductance mechanosensitive channel